MIATIVFESWVDFVALLVAISIGTTIGRLLADWAKGNLFGAEPPS